MTRPDDASFVASYVAGDWVAVSAPGRWLLVDLPPQDDTVQRCWAAISAGATVVDVLDVLVSRGLGATPSFALVAADGDGVRVIARGTAAVHLGDGTEITSAGQAIWADVLLDTDPWQVTLVGGKPGFSEVRLPMAAGVTLAATVHLAVSTEQPAVSTEQPAVSTEQPAVSTDPQPEPETVSEEPVSYDHLFGATQLPKNLPEPESLEPESPELHSESPAAATASWHTMQPADAGLIDSVPNWSGSQPSAAQTPRVPQPSAPPQPDVERTVNRATLVRSAVTPESGTAAPTVLAARCPEGHLTPAHSAHCRVCNLPVPEQAAFEVARPPLGVLRLSSGDSVKLDHGVLIGRAPSAPAGGVERPHLVRVASPENDVSRNHAEVVLDGWHVFVRDLGSVNGTTVELPGQPPVRLREGDLQLLEPGSVITLADELRCVFEVT